MSASSLVSVPLDFFLPPGVYTTPTPLLRVNGSSTSHKQKLLLVLSFSSCSVKRDVFSIGHATKRNVFCNIIDENSVIGFRGGFTSLWRAHRFKLSCLSFFLCFTLNVLDQVPLVFLSFLNKKKTAFFH